ncbi:Atxe2 family lasso peptide isopeptidase (plasmid) [Novosphingobium resinovorum]|uniref:Peptidase S9 prolyl oligopeptidase catalytic domain-containing protein n=1 Tax=Novosphingobium resinovorum TaxID=158500 RepID=A0A1D8AFJ8_9SPHN|nr:MULTISPECIES: Atxe2 family lasso peptide isopeptidase [Novosphingobium]AOR80894.1 hypothetical protein BES08_29325 [Novosphingobium resinovorum]MBF7015113.1 Atxe2 family lasso peptide isopeptidase [Novosphingobium sp. HR1a]WJM29798.1 Atxe2 family lasso peptide isopeptidase [Novosphingobium resinovorum]
METAARPERPAKRPITVSDMLGIRNIGSSERGEESRIFAISPERSHIAFFVTQADVAGNTICRALVSMPLQPGATPQVLDVGGQPIFEDVAVRGLQTDYGYPAEDIPVWSPDGQWLAYRKREEGVTELWRVRVDGTQAARVARLPADVAAVAWTSDGKRLIAAMFAEIAEAKERRDFEGLSGYRYDDRFVPYNDTIPSVEMSGRLDFVKVSPETGAVVPASADEARLVQTTALPTSDEELLRTARNPQNETLETRLRDPEQLFKRFDLWARLKNGRDIRCTAVQCSGSVFDPINRIWWSRDGRDALILRRDGWGASETALFRWSPHQSSFQKIFRTSDLLAGCEMVKEGLICGRESSGYPRRLVNIDTRSGESTVLWDPNPTFAKIEKGRVTRLHWRNEFGAENFGDLVVPPGRRNGEAIPLVVVQYNTRGFLRGGTGDEYPIWLFAQRGFAVLSVQKSRSYISQVPDSALSDWAVAHAQAYTEYKEQRNQVSSITAGVEKAISMGIADSERIGITGLSAGSSTAIYALLNTSMFSAAALSSMGIDPDSMVYGGARLRNFRIKEGYPTVAKENPSFWRHTALAVNADRFQTPLLMQLGSRESLLGIEAFEALRAHHRPVEMFVFANEGHLKWQPAHRAAIYERNLDWFDFWLKNKIDPAKAKIEQYRAWQGLREEATSDLKAGT